MLYPILILYRRIPLFKGKLSMSKILFRKLLNNDKSRIFLVKENIKYKIPNTLKTWE